MLVEYWHILTDPAHLAVELTFVVGDLIVVAGLVRLSHRRIDREHGHRHKAAR